MNRWPNQIFGFSEVRRLRSEGVRRICLTSPTGTGKALLLSDLIEADVQAGLKVSLYTNRKLLIEQLSRTLTSSGISHGIRAADYLEDFSKQVQISSIQTEVSRCIKTKKWNLHPANSVYVDEAHLLAADGAQELQSRHLEVPGSWWTGVTATPLEIGHMYDKLVVAGNMSQGRACGALVFARHYGIDEPDMRKFKQSVKTGEYKEGDVIKAIMTKNVFGRVFEHWKLLNPDAKPTILFAPGVKESIWFAEQFRKQGVRSAHIDGANCWVDNELYPTSLEVREQILRDVRKGDIQVVSNRFCLDAETEILTDLGWVDVDGMTLDHNVANWNADGSIFFAKPKDIVRRGRYPDERMVVLETPRRSIRVTESHMMVCRNEGVKEWSKVRAADLVDKSTNLPVSGIAAPFPISVVQPKKSKNLAARITANAFALRSRGFDPEKSREEAERRILAREALRYKEPGELTDAECEFIGFWVGDGNKNKLSSGGVEYRMWENSEYTNTVARIEWLLAEIGVDNIKKEIKNKETGHVVLQWSMPRGTGFGPQKRRGVFPIEPYLEKNGTNLFWALSSHQFDCFLRGLWMANGTSHGDVVGIPEARLSICSARKCLLDLLQAIAVCRGYRASIRQYDQSTGGGIIYHLSLTKAIEHNATKYTLQLEDGWKDEVVWCVESDSGNIVTRRRGSVTVMGNCLREGVDIRELEHMILATVVGSLQSYLQMCGRLLRACPESGKKEACIQDHGGHFWRAGLGSVNVDRDWDLDITERMMTGLQEEALRDKKVKEPICCPQCRLVRSGGSICPECGFKATRSSRIVIQQDGKLVEHTGDVYKPRITKKKPNTEKLWEDMYWRMRRAEMTFGQARGLFFYENYYWPPQDIPFMPLPTSPLAWYKKIPDVPMSDLYPKQSIEKTLF